MAEPGATTGFTSRAHSRQRTSVKAPSRFRATSPAVWYGHVRSAQCAVSPSLSGRNLVLMAAAPPGPQGRLPPELGSTRLARLHFVTLTRRIAPLGSGHV